MALTIGDLGKATNTKVETIRYYERIGLLPKPRRTAGNYRDYGSAELGRLRSEEHTSELQSLMRISYAVFCLKKKIYIKQITMYHSDREQHVDCHRAKSRH